MFCIMFSQVETCKLEARWSTSGVRTSVVCWCRQRRSAISSKLFVTRETHRETETETDIQRDKEADKEAEHLDNSSIRAPSLRQKNIDNPQMRRRKDGEEMIYHFKVCNLIHLHMAGMSTGSLSRSVASVHANLWTSTKRTHRKYITSRQTSPAHVLHSSSPRTHGRPATLAVRPLPRAVTPRPAALAHAGKFIVQSVRLYRVRPWGQS